MKLLAITHKFSNAAKEDASLLERPSFLIKDKTFNQILKPIQQILINDPVYSCYKMDISKQLQELRQICSEVQARHTTDDLDLKVDRSKLLNALQGILESAQGAKNGSILVDYDDLFELPNLTDIIRGNAKIYKEFMGAPLVADALYQVADNIDDAQARGWEPENSDSYFLDAPAANDENYYQQNVS